MEKNNKNGFTLVELLAVIVILAIILVIAVPKVMSIIEDAKMGTLESTAKMIASQAEKQKVQNAVLGNDKEITCDSVAQLNKEDYPSCEITFDDNTAKVTIVGGGKFAGLNVCEGTKTSAIAQKEECLLVCKSNEVIVENFKYEINDYDSCVNYLKPVVVDEWNEVYLQAVCRNEGFDAQFPLRIFIKSYISESIFTKEELISNNIVAPDSVFEESNITVGDYDSCVSYLKPVVVDEWGANQEYLESLCSGDITGNWTQNMIDRGIFTKDELIENNVIGSDSVVTNIKPGNKTSCVNGLKEVYIDDGGTIEELESLCSEGVYYDYRGIDAIINMMEGKIFTRQELIENNVIKGVIGKRCVKETPIECFGFEDGVITEYNDTCGTEVVIPNQINGTDVVEIGSGTFKNSGITTIKLPPTLIKIGYDAFSSNNISVIEIPNSVTYIGGAAFYENPLIYIKINNLNTIIGCDAFGDPSKSIHNLPSNYDYDCLPT